MACSRKRRSPPASRIEQYIVQVQRQLVGSALPQVGAEGVEQRQFEFQRLLKQVPEVTDIAYLAADGCEKMRVSRLEMDASGECLSDRRADAGSSCRRRARPTTAR